MSMTLLLTLLVGVEKGNIIPSLGNDVSNLHYRGMYERVTSLRRKNTNLKILIAIGGWTLNPG